MSLYILPRMKYTHKVLPVCIKYLCYSAGDLRHCIFQVYPFKDVILILKQKNSRIEFMSDKAFRAVLEYESMQYYLY